MEIIRVKDLCSKRAGGRLALIALALGAAACAARPLAAQTSTATTAGATAGEPPGALKTALALAATFDGGGPIQSGLHWRVFAAQADANGMRKLVAESRKAAPILPLPEGDYVAHVAYGLAGASRAVSVPSEGAASVRFALKAGALRVVGMLGDAQIPPEDLSIDVYVPQPGNSEAKLVVKDARPDEIMGLPEGLYHIVSTYLDKVGEGSFGSSGRGASTNSVVSADLRVQVGKLTDVTLRHHAAVLTLKLVNAPGGEALANTSFTVLTPGGDVIRELVGAFPSLVLAEGDYVVIARRNGKSYQSTFSVQSSVNRDIEVLTK